MKPLEDREFPTDPDAIYSFSDKEYKDLFDTMDFINSLIVPCIAFIVDEHRGLPLSENRNITKYYCDCESSIQKAMQLIFSVPIEELPLYINEGYSREQSEAYQAIIRWRLSLGK